MMLLAVMPALVLASVKQVEVDGYTYNIIEKAHVAELVKCNLQLPNELTVPASVTYEGETYPVEIIGGGVFNEYYWLTSVTIPDGIKRIGNYAFASCDLRTLTIGDSVRIIGDGAFQNCHNLKTVKMGKNVESIGYAAFGSYAGMDVYVDDISLWLKCSHGSMNAIDHPYSLYVGGVEVTELEIHDGVTEIADGVFIGCKNIKTVKIPEGVVKIGDNAFSYCENLTTVVLSKNLREIGREAFRNCGSLTEINLPFGLETIGESAFFRCHSLASITLPTTLSTLGNNVLAECESLESITLPSNLKNIPEQALTRSGVKTVIIHDGIEKINNHAFAYCGALKDVYCYAAQVPETGGWVFDDMDFGNATLHVPADAAEAYRKADLWKDFGQIVAVEPLAKCAKPEISYKDGRLTFTSETEGALFVSMMENVDMGVAEGNRRELGVAYTMSVYAVKDGMQNSDVATATLGWTDVEPELDGIENGKMDFAQTVRTLKLYGTDGEPCGTMDVNFLLTTDKRGRHTALIYKPRAYVDQDKLMTDGIPAFSNATGEAGVLALPDVIEDEAGVVYTVDSIGSCAFYGCGELLGIDFGSQVQAIGTQAFQRSALQGTVTIPANIRRIGIQAFTNTKGVTMAIFQHRQANEVWWGVGNKDDFAGPRHTVLEVCQGIIDECAHAERGDNFIYWYAENRQSMQNTYGDRVPNQLMMNGVAVTTANASDILGDATAHYNALTRTLTLDGCVAEDLRTTVIGGITVRLVGENQLRSVDAFKSALTLTSDETAEGRLTVQGSVMLDRSDMTVSGCRRVEVNDEFQGLYAVWHEDETAHLTVNNSVLYVGMMRGFTDLHLVDVSLPQNAIFAAATGNEERSMANLFQVWNNQVYELGSATIQYYEPPVQDEVGVAIQTDFAVLFGGEDSDKTPYNNEYDGVLYHLYREVSESDLSWPSSPVVNYYRDGALYLTTEMTDEQMEAIAAADNLNTDEFRAYNGLVVHVGPSYGIITIDCATRWYTGLKVKVGAQEPVIIQTDGRQTIEVPYRTDKDCYIYIYASDPYTVMEESRRMSAARRSTVEFPDETVAQLFGLSLTVEGVSGVKSVALDDADGMSRWYDLLGRRVLKPTKEGLYIRNGRKVMVK